MGLDAFFTPSQIELRSLFVSLFLLPTLFNPSELLLSLPPMPKKKSREEFFQRAREKGSETNKEIVNDTEIKEDDMGKLS